MRAFVLLLAGYLALAGCAGIPDAGPVEKVQAPASRTHSTVRYEPAGPRRDATPLAVVEGYLDAMLAYPQASGIVEQFLTPEGRKEWDPAESTIVYATATPSVRVVSDNVAQVAVQLRTVMTVDEDGRADTTPKHDYRVLQLARVAGQWRIENPAPGYWLSQGFARDYVNARALWFFDESGRRLVPELAHSIVSEQLPATLIKQLADGPRSSTHRTFVPALNRLDLRVIGDVVELDLRAEDDRAHEKLKAQILSTLRDVPGIDKVRILVDGEPQGSDLDIDAVVGFGQGPGPSRAYAVRRNKVVDVTTKAKPLAGPWGRSARGARDVVVGSKQVAALRSDRSEVLVGRRTGGAVATYTGDGLVRPSWDDAGRLWLVDNPADARFRVVDGAATVDLEPPEDFEGTVESFAVSPDGSRYAAVVIDDDGRQVVVGDIGHDVDGFPRRLGDPVVVSHGLAGEKQVGWDSQTRVQFIAGSGEEARLHSVGLDGADASGGSGSAALPAGVRTWSGAPVENADRWALDREGRVWHLADGQNWQLVPGQAGGGFRGLSSGR